MGKRAGRGELVEGGRGLGEKGNRRGGGEGVDGDGKSKVWKWGR